MTEDPPQEPKDARRQIESYLRDVEQSLLEATVHESQLEEALVTRALIGEAMGIIMIQNNSTAEEAFETLKQLSQHSNIKLRELAERLVRAAEESATPRSRDDRVEPGDET